MADGNPSSQQNALQSPFSFSHHLNNNNNSQLQHIQNQLNQITDQLLQHQINGNKILANHAKQSDAHSKLQITLIQNQCEHLTNQSKLLEVIRQKTAPTPRETLSINKTMHITKDFNTSSYPQNNLTSKTVLNHIQNASVRSHIIDQTLNSALNTIKNMFKQLTQKMVTIAKQRIHIEHLYIPWEDRNYLSIQILQLNKDIEEEQYKIRIAKQSINSFRNYIYKSEQTISMCIAYTDKFQKFVQKTRNDFQIRIAYIEQNPSKCSLTYPHMQLDQLRSDLGTFEWEYHQQFIKFVKICNKRTDEIRKRKTKEFIKANMIDEPIEEFILSVRNFPEVRQTLNTTLAAYDYDRNENSEDSKDRILPSELLAQYTHEHMQIDDVKEAELNDKIHKLSLEIVYNRNLNIINRFKIAYVTPLWFKPTQTYTDKPIWNWKYLKTNAHSLKVKIQIIKKYGNKTDKQFLQNINKFSKNYKPKQKQYQQNKQENWHYI